MNYKGYAVRIEYSEEDDCFVGHIDGINDVVGFHGNSVAELEAAAKKAQRLSNQENVTLKEKMRLKNEAEKARAAFEKARNDRYKAFIGLGILGSGGELTHIAKKAGIL